MVVGPGTGHHRFRIRQRLVRDHYAPLIRGKSYGAVKLDLLLRCVALGPDDLGERKDPPGFVLWDWSFEELYNLVRDEPAVRAQGERDDERTRHLKRKWVADQLATLHERKLVRLKPRAGRRPAIIMRRDDGTGKLFDDPGRTFADERDPTKRELFFTINGGLIGSGELKTWTATELAAYFAALSAEFHAPRSSGQSTPTGTGQWYRPLAWFNTAEWAPKGRVLLPFAASQIEKGLLSLQQKGLILIQHGVTRDPRDAKRRFNQRRNIYQNRFNVHDEDYDLGRLRAGGPSAATSAEAPPSVADVVMQGVAREQKQRADKAQARS